MTTADDSAPTVKGFVESTVEVYPGYVVVEKRGASGRTAEAEAGG